MPEKNEKSQGSGTLPYFSAPWPPSLVTIPQVFWLCLEWSEEISTYDQALKQNSKWTHFEHDRVYLVCIMHISVCVRLQVLCPAVDKWDRLLDKVARTQESLLLEVSLRHSCTQISWGQVHRVMRRNGKSQREPQVSMTAEAIETSVARHISVCYRVQQWTQPKSRPDN